MHGAWREIGDGVLVGRFRFYNQDIGAVVGAGGVLVVDTRTTPGQAREVLEDLRSFTRLPVGWFVNTHWHYDHTFGNATFRPAEGWGHVACVAGLITHGERMRSSMIDERPDMGEELRRLKIDPPERTLETVATVDIGDRLVELRFLGRGHTDSDIVVTIPHAGVLFAGDLLENGAPPYFGDGYPLDWPGTVEAMLGLVDGPVVPGHGDVADRRFVQEQLVDLTSVASLARRVDAEGATIDDLLAHAPWDGGPLVREALERAVMQLRGELDPRSA